MGQTCPKCSSASCTGDPCWYDAALVGVRYEGDCVWIDVWIDVCDADGVHSAPAPPELDPRRVAELEAENKRLRTENHQLRARLDEMDIRAGEVLDSPVVDGGRTSVRPEHVEALRATMARPPVGFTYDGQPLDRFAVSVRLPDPTVLPHTDGDELRDVKAPGAE